MNWPSPGYADLYLHEVAVQWDVAVEFFLLE